MDVYLTITLNCYNKNVALELCQMLSKIHKESDVKDKIGQYLVTNGITITDDVNIKPVNKR